MSEDDGLREMLRPLTDEEYAAVPVPSPEEIRRAFARGADVLRMAARQQRRRPP